MERIVTRYLDDGAFDWAGAWSDRAALIAEVERTRGMRPPAAPGAPYPTAEQLIREDRDSR
jgi:hypothetical protein